jgi:hypothetical protein
MFAGAASAEATEAVGDALILRRTVPVALFSWQLGVFVLVEIEPLGLETNTKQ